MTVKDVKFIKMHGLGNDFVIIDNRKHTIKPTPKEAQWICNRNTGIGCDQLVLIEPSKKADCFMRIYNQDGGEVSSCGNASRCVAWLIGKEENKKEVVIETKAGLLECEMVDRMMVAVDMGKPKLKWNQIPLAKHTDTLHLPIKLDRLADPVAVSMGNPHMVFFTKDVKKFPLSEVGSKLEHHPLFPERANVEIAKITSKSSIELRVWERGAGETLACGTGACATVVAAHLRGLTGRKARVKLPGGELTIEWKDNDHVIMTGPVQIVFAGIFNL